MAEKRQKFKEDQLTIRSSRFGGQLIKFERVSYGWEFVGYDTDEEITGVDNNGNIKKKAFKNLYFRRPDPYTKNFLFKLFEFLSKIV